MIRKLCFDSCSKDANRKRSIVACSSFVQGTQRIDLSFDQPFHKLLQKYTNSKLPQQQTHFKLQKTS